MKPPDSPPAVIIEFHDLPNGDVSPVLRSRSKIRTATDRTPAQQLAYDVMQGIIERQRAAGGEVQQFEKRGDMTEFRRVED